MAAGNEMTMDELRRQILVVGGTGSGMTFRLLSPPTSESCWSKGKSLWILWILWIRG